MTEYEKCPKCGGKTRIVKERMKPLSRAGEGGRRKGHSPSPGHKCTHRKCRAFKRCGYGYFVHEYTNVTDAGKLPVVTWAKAMAPLRVKGRKVKG